MFCVSAYGFNPESANRNKSRLLLSSAEMFKQPLWQTVSAPIGAVYSRATLFASILNLSVILGNYLQQTTISDDFFLGALRVNKQGVRLNSPTIIKVHIMFKCLIHLTFHTCL